MAAPESITVPGRSVAGSWTACRLASTSNVLSALQTQGMVDGVRVVHGDRLLWAGQTLPQQNGLWVADVTGAELVSGSPQFVDNAHTISGLAANQVFSWTKGANTTSLTNGTETLTASGWFKCQGTSITLNGTTGQDVLDSLKQAELTRATDADASGDFVRHRTVSVTHGTANAGRSFRYDGKETPTVGSDALTFVAGPQPIIVP